MEITKREIAFSLIILFVLCAVGFVIHDKIFDSMAVENEQYYKAVKIMDDPDLFNYILETRAGDILAHGTFKAVTPVTDAEVKGEYMYLEKVHERYTMHTRTVTTTVNGKTSTRVETYWTWDYAGSEDKGTEYFEFLSNHIWFDKSKFPKVQLRADDLAVDSSDGYISDGYHKRHYFNAVKDKGTGSLFTDGNLENYTLYHDQTPEEIIKEKEDSQNRFHLVFWIGAVAIIAVVIGLFCYAENRWLE